MRVEYVTGLFTVILKGIDKNVLYNFSVLISNIVNTDISHVKKFFGFLS